MDRGVAIRAIAIPVPSEFEQDLQGLKGISVRLPVRDDAIGRFGYPLCGARTVRGQMVRSGGMRRDQAG
jgi:hypothetical protein